MLPLAAILGLGGLGAGLLKSELIDKPREKREQELASITTRFSPWTGLKADPVHYADPFSNALQFGTTGAMVGSGITTAEAEKNLVNGLVGKKVVDDFTDNKSPSNLDNNDFWNGSEWTTNPARRSPWRLYG